MMKNFLLALVLAVGASCVGTSQSFNAENIGDATRIVIERHDQYVTGDDQLDQPTRDQCLGESYKLTSLLQASPIPADLFRAAAVPVMDRYDQYVRNDVDLSAPVQVRYLRTTTLLRKLLTVSSK